MAVDTKKFEVAFEGASKENVIESGALLSPNPQSVAIYINAVDNFRQSEIDSGWIQCRDKIIDDGLFDSGTAATLYVYVPIGDGDGAVVVEPILGNIPANTLFIGIAGNFRTLRRGSTVFQSMIEYCMMAAHDNYLKLV